jgi:adenine phosphoribosyltransferase
MQVSTKSLSGDGFYMTYKITVAGLQRDLPLCPISDKMMIGAFVIFGDVELTCACASELLKIAPEFDYMVAPEAKAIPLAFEMARQSGRNDYFLVRKAPKLYMNGVFEAEDKSITTAGTQKLYMDGADAAKLKGKRVLILDDVISTGGSLKAVESLVDQAGGIVVGKMAILAEGAAADRDDILFLEKLPLFNEKGEPID